MSIPTVIIFKNGQEVKRFVGVQPKEVYLNFLAPASAGE
jgi:thioredoxin-like negative regulator of GroEL